MTGIYQPGIRVRVDPKFFDPFNMEIIDIMKSKTYGCSNDDYSHYRGFLQNPETGEYDRNMIVKIPRKYIEQQKKGDMICVYGDDAFLKYYFICLDCGTISIQDDRELYAVVDYGCPQCNHIPREKYPFEIITKEDYDKTILKIPDECAFEEMRGMKFSARSIMQGAFQQELWEA